MCSCRSATRMGATAVRLAAAQAAGLPAARRKLRLVRGPPIWPGGTGHPRRRSLLGRWSITSWRCPKPSGWRSSRGEYQARFALGQCDGQSGYVEGLPTKKTATYAAKWEAVAQLQACQGMSERRACRVIDADRKSVHYRSIRNDPADLREKLREKRAEQRLAGGRTVDRANPFIGGAWA